MIEPQEESSYRMLFPFLDESHSFCHGFEMGQLYAMMRDDDRHMFPFTIHIENLEQSKLIAESCGWLISPDSFGEDFTLLRCKRK